MAKYRFFLSHDKDFATVQQITDPIGWDTFTETLKRGEGTEGFAFTQGAKLQFTAKCQGSSMDGGFHYIRDSYDTNGYFEETFLIVQFACNDNYVIIYKGRLNLLSYEFDEVLGICSAELEQIGDAMDILSLKDTPVNLLSNLSLDESYTFPSNAYKNVSLHSQGTHLGTALWTNHTQLAVAHNELYPDNLGIKTEIFKIPMVLDRSDIEANPFYSDTDLYTHNNIGITPNPPSNGPLFFYPPLSGYVLGGNDMLFKATEDVDFKLRLRIFISATLPLDNQFSFARVELLKNTTVIAADNYSFSSDSFAHCFSIDIDESLVLDDELHLRLVTQFNFVNYALNGVPDDFAFLPTYQYFNTGSIKLTLQRAPGAPTPCVCVPIYEAFDRIVRSYTNSRAVFVSTYFGRSDLVDYSSDPDEPINYASNGCSFNYVITRGLLIRRFPLTGSGASSCDDINPDVSKPVRLDVSFKDLFDAMNAIFCLGFEIYQDVNGLTIVRVEPKTFFYNNVFWFTMSSVPKLKREVDGKDFYKTIEVGYEKWLTEHNEGLDELHANHIYQISNNKIQDKKLDIKSSFVASGYSIQSCQDKPYNMFPLDSTDFDDELFIIATEVEDTGMDNSEAGVPGIYYTGLLRSDTIYNARISPNLNFQRWLNVLAIQLPFSVFTKCAKFAGNNSANYFIGITCSNAQNIPFDHPEGVEIDSSEKIHKPEIISFEYPITFAQYEIMKTRLHDVIRVISPKFDFYAYLIEVKYAFNTGLTNFKMYVSNYTPAP